MQFQLYLTVALIAACAYAKSTEAPKKQLDVASKEVKDLVRDSLRGLNEKSPSEHLYSVVEIKHAEESKEGKKNVYDLEVIVVENKNCPKKGNKNLECNEKANDLDDKQKVSIKIVGSKSNRKYDYELSALDD